MELRIPRKFKDVLDQNSALSGLVNTSINEFGEWLKQNNVKFFTEYTDHSLEHVENVLQTAHDLIRDECKAFITPHDVATLILAVLLHDSAMHISEDGFINLVKEDFNSNINGFEDKSWNRLWAEFLAESRRFSGRKLIALFGDAEPVRHPPLDDLQKLNGKDLLLCGEFLRRHHSRLAHEIALFGVPGPDGRILKLPVTDDTSHVVDLAGLVARSHGLSIRDCFEYLQTNYSSVKMVRGVHPTFLMALLRIADVLQIQSNRAPKQVLKVRQLKSPTSSGEWEMHQAIKDISSKEYPETIWVVAKPENVKTYLRIRNLLDQIQLELDSSWTVIGEIYGYDPEFREFGLKIRRIRSNIDDVDSFSKQVTYIPVHASFEVADTDLLKLLIGPLYGEKAEIGIRELIQNAIDAVNELHEYKKQINEQKLDLPSQEGDVVISIDQKGNDWWLTISDCGIGMTLNTVKEYFLKAGASLRRSEIWKKTFEDEDGKSKILRSGRFGIGALAAFLIGNEIKISTRHVSNPTDYGIEFDAQIDTESIEIKHINRPIGTTVTIKLGKDAIASIVPLSDDNKWSVKTKNEKWDWYCLDTPKVLRRINQVNLNQENFLPTLNSDLPVGWHRTENSEFEEIHWSYLPFSPSLTCNGIIVMSQDAGARYRIQAGVNDKHISFARPNLSIFDFNAKFPLNIQRTDLTSEDLPFQNELLKNIVRDYITFVLVEAPTEKLSNKTVDYYGGIRDVEPYQRYRDASISQWVSTDSGTCMICDPTLFNRLGRKSALVSFSYVDEISTPKLIWPPDGIIVKLSIDASQRVLNSLNNAIGTGLGLDVVEYVSREFIATKIVHHGTTINSARLLVSKRTIKALEEYREYSELDTDFFQDVHNISLPIFDVLSNYSETKSQMNEKSTKINVEWEDNNWILLRNGECPNSEFDFERFAHDNVDEDNPKWPPLMAEWYFLGNEEPTEKSIFAQLWDELIQSPMIPYDLTIRKKELNHAYRELDADIKNYLATKELIEKEIKKRREEV